MAPRGILDSIQRIENSGPVRGLLDIIAAGPQRRAALDEKVGDFMTYITPPHLRPAVEMVGQMNPVQGMADSMSQFGVAADPNQLPEARRRAAAQSALEAVLAIAPAAVASRGYMTPAQGLMESVLGGSPATQQIGDDIGQFWVDEAGNIRVWHGSPHDFDKFSMDHIGTGEGAQVTGRGLYVSDDPWAAATYMVPDLRGVPIGEKSKFAGGGHLYEADLAGDVSDYLDVNAAVKDLPDTVQDIVKPYMRASDEFADDRSLAFYIGKADGLEGELSQAGVPGVRKQNYSGDTEFVVFDDNLLSILSKDGNRLAASDPVTQRGDEVLGLLSSGRADEVTDAMLDMGDSVQNARLNEYLFNNYDLPMDEASRMARAGEIASYHGTDRDFTAFDPRRFGEKDPGWYGRGVTSDTDPEVAAGYANYNEAEVGQQIMPLRFGGRYIEWPEGQLPFGNARDSMAGTKDMQALGYSGSKMTNDRDLYGGAPEWGTEYVTFDPSNIRSKFARFDPRLSHLRNLSAGLAGIGLLDILGLTQQQQQQGGI